MEKGFNYVKEMVVNFKLDWCCWYVPLRIGLFIIAYFNILLAVVALIGIADESFAPIVVQIQNTIMEDFVTKPVPMLAYATELSSNMILLCALYRKDLKLMRAYMIYCIAALIASVMFYSLVVAAVGVVVAFAMGFSILYQIYVLVLVRSMIVAMRLANKEQLPIFLTSSPIIYDEPKKSESDVEAPADHEDKGDSFDTKLQTVDEDPKEETKEDTKNEEE